ncbi:MAG: prephenate dehydrogenase/arogenate dehydrogenase family protein [Candidatus Gastranaerophilales bacterium]|nr:prephenate dehydrogenase/arogenate dehydrogenase family protein [Candidatus Gastranaerophilales bacterium]
MKKVGIIGLGLIGASILKGLFANKNYEIFCYSNSSFKEAKKYTKNSSNSLDIIKNCDIIFVCTSASRTLETLKRLDGLINKKTIVVDVCSIKNKLLDKTFNFNFILSHPMAGSEKSGFSAGNKNLFKNTKWLIGKENKILKQIIIDLGAKPIKIDMNTHDELTAQISHLPTILSFLLFECANIESKKIASSGFRDTTRLAMTNEDLALSMFNNNKDNILKAFDNLTVKLNSLKKMSNDEKIKLFKDIAQNRAKMYDSNGKNIL